jgi:F-type H+-transporting ATPase subunit delta
MSGENKLARPYAKALFELARAKETYAFWTDALRVAKEISQHPSVIAMIKNPAITQEKITSFFKEIGGDLFDESVHRLLSLLVDNKRLLLMPAIFDLFDEMKKEDQKIIDVELTSAYPLSEDIEGKITQALQRRMQKTIHLNCKTDPSILGGAIIRAGDWVIDGTIKGRLTKVYDAISIS